MAKKKKFSNILIDSYVSISFVGVSLLLVLLDFLVLKGKISRFLASPLINSVDVEQGANIFNVASVKSYVQMIFYIFVPTSVNILFTDLILILLLGPTLEDRYGITVIGVMIFICALFSGVLNACFCKNSLTGPSCIVYMMIFLNIFFSLIKKKIPLSFVVIFVLLIVKDVLVPSENGIVGIIVNICGGLCGSLIAFLASPKVRATKKESKGGLLSKAEKLAYIQELDSQSPRFKNAESKKDKKTASSEEETVIGTLKF